MPTNIPKPNKRPTMPNFGNRGKPRIDVTDDDFTCILTAAVRYSIGRQTYMPMLVCNYITALLPHLSDKALWLFEREIREHREVYKNYDKAFGDPQIDKPVWDKFYTDVCAEINRREENNDKRNDVL